MAKKLTDFCEYWRGGVEQWECDNMGHMNVRFWMRRFYDSLAPFANEIGIGRAFSSKSKETLTMRQAHLKFIKEAHVASALYLKGGAIGINDNKIEYYAEIRHSKSDSLAATLIAKLFYINGENAETIKIPDAIIANIESAKCIIPDYAKPRSINLSEDIAAHNLDWAVKKGFSPIGLMAVRAHHCDIFGRFLPENYFGFISEAVPNLIMLSGESRVNIGSDTKTNGPRIGGAVLENRFEYFDAPNAGDVLTILSGVVALADKTRTIQHRIFDAISGLPVCISEAIVANFDLDQRKAVSFSPEIRSKITKQLILL